MGIVKALSLNCRVNLPGLAAAFLLFYTALSNKPWWTLTGGLGGQPTFSAEVSPFAVAVEMLGRPVAVPIIPYITLAARFSMLLAASAMLAGSLLANKPWSKPMMSTRGFALPILFLLGLFAGLQLAGSYAGASLPLTGKFNLKYTVTYGESTITVTTPTVAALTQEYWIALTAGATSILAKAIHGKISHHE